MDEFSSHKLFTMRFKNGEFQFGLWDFVKTGELDGWKLKIN